MTWITSALLASLVLAGCSGGDGNGSNTPVVSPGPDQAEVQTGTSPAVASSLQETDQAIDNGNYEEAADQLLKLEFSNRQMNRQDAAQQISRMQRLQEEIADGLARGDPNAVRAAQLLQRSAALRNQYYQQQRRGR